MFRILQSSPSFIWFMHVLCILLIIILAIFSKYMWSNASHNRISQLSLRSITRQWHWGFTRQYNWAIKRQYTSAVTRQYNWAITRQYTSAITRQYNWASTQQYTSAITRQYNWAITLQYTWCRGTLGIGIWIASCKVRYLVPSGWLKHPWLLIVLTSIMSVRLVEDKLHVLFRHFHN